MLALVAFVDGGSLGNPGPSGIGVVIDGSEHGKIDIAKWIGHQDNNVAEYVALLVQEMSGVPGFVGSSSPFSESPESPQVPMAG